MLGALIPPIAHLEEFTGEDKFHLVLSHLLDNQDYHAFYRQQRLRGAYLVLDNGAHENTAGERMQHLLQKAFLIRANEVVLPDTLFDHRATVRGAEDAFIYMLGPGQDFWEQYPNLMLVPQGRTQDEWQRCFQDLIEIYAKAQQARPDLFTKHITIGVSKDYDQWAGGHHALLEFLEGFREWLTFQTHLLGWARDLRVLSQLAARFPWIRSTDSAKPFVYAYSGIQLQRHLSEVPEYPKRPPDYFGVRFGLDTIRKSKHNVMVFREAAGDTRY